MLYIDMELIELFTKDLKPAQRQYEALRAVAFEEGSIEKIAQRFGYKAPSLRTLVNRLKNGKHQLFPDLKPGPRKRHTPPDTTESILKLRREKRWSAKEIAEELNRTGSHVSTRTVERILKDAGIAKLHRRTYQERGITKKGLLIPDRSANLEPKHLKPFRADCQVAGVFLFLPYILESGVLDIVQQCDLPESNGIGKRQAALSMLLLKLIGCERLSHISQYDTDRGFGLFAGLNVLPKPSYICSYSCRTNAAALNDFQHRIIENLRSRYPDIYQGKTINLDFHSIPHFGDESEMEQVWCGARGKTMKGANTFFAQDGESDLVIYADADIKRAESPVEIKRFVDYWLEVKGIVGETLVFDAKLTNYNTLYELDEQSIPFITLRRRSHRLIEETLSIPDKDWARVYLPIPKRKHKRVRVHQSRVSLIRGRKPFRQFTVKDHGRAEPTFIITNNDKIKQVDILTIYAKRWHIENKLGELVKFFSLNALSSPVMIRIHFDLLWTIIADTLYHLFARDLRRFEQSRADSIFRRFIDAPGQIHFDGSTFVVKIRKRAATPLLLGVEKLRDDLYIPWIGDKPLRIVWTP